MFFLKFGPTCYSQVHVQIYHFFPAKQFSLRTLLNSVRSRRQAAANGDSVIFVHPNGHEKSSAPSAAAPSVAPAGGRSNSPLDGSSNPELENVKPDQIGASAFGDLGAGMGGPGLGGAGERSLSPLGGGGGGPEGGAGLGGGAGRSCNC